MAVAGLINLDHYLIGEFYILPEAEYLNWPNLLIKFA